MDIALIVIIDILVWCVYMSFKTVYENWEYTKYIEPYLEDEDGAQNAQRATPKEQTPQEMTIMIDPESLKPIIKQIMEEMENEKGGLNR